MKSYLKNGFQYVEFESLAELVDCAERAPDGSATKKYVMPKYCKHTYSETIDAARFGWPEGTKEIDIAVNRIGSSLSDVDAYSVNYDVTGEFVDVGRFVSGEPECFGVVVSEPLPTETVCIDISVATSSGTKQDTIVNRGAAIAALIERLTPAYFVKLRLMDVASGLNKAPEGYKNMAVVVNVDTRNGFSRDLLSFVCAHPGFLRRLILAAMETITGVADLGGYGRPMDLPASERLGLYFPIFGNNSGFSTIEQAASKVREYLEQAKLTAARE